MSNLIVRQYNDDYGNKAIIEEIKILPYNGAKKRINAYRLSLIAEYDKNLVYHVSICEALEQAIAVMFDYSNRTWKEVDAQWLATKP